GSMSHRRAVAPALSGRNCTLADARNRCAAMRHVAHAWAETLPAEGRDSTVAAFVCEAMAAYENCRDGSDVNVGDLNQPEAELARSAGLAAAALPLLEALHWLTSLY